MESQLQGTMRIGVFLEDFLAEVRDQSFPILRRVEKMSDQLFEVNGIPIDRKFPSKDLLRHRLGFADHQKTSRQSIKNPTIGSASGFVHVIRIIRKQPALLIQLGQLGIRQKALVPISHLRHPLPILTEKAKAPGDLKFQH